MTEREIKPWYREPWPWIIIGSLGVVVIGCFVTLGIAIWSDDGLVADDYYKRGMAINKTLVREIRSGALGLSASLTPLPDETVQVTLQSGVATFTSPQTLHLRFVHPRYPDKDEEVTLTQVKNGVYSGRLALPTTGSWEVVLEGDDWRLPILKVQAPITEILWKKADAPVEG
ncbi:MAG: FixH family protein [Burkholderiales bacterium]|jgi:hypothetical protein|nr:FixH family protein [Burkholderiales bacterium]